MQWIFDCLEMRSEFSKSIVEGLRSFGENTNIFKSIFPDKIPPTLKGQAEVQGLRRNHARTKNQVDKLDFTIMLIKWWFEPFRNSEGIPLAQPNTYFYRQTESQGTHSMNTARFQFTALSSRLTRLTVSTMKQAGKSWSALLSEESPHRRCRAG